MGQPLGRVDGVAKVRGTARYVDDLKLPNMWFGATKRSKVAHGFLKSITLGTDFDWSEVVVVTADDIPGRNTILLMEEDQPALVAVGEHVRHFDEALALHEGVLRVRGGHALSHYHLGVIYQEMGSVEDAERQFTRFLEMWSNADEGLPELVDARRRLVDLADARLRSDTD